MQTTIDANPPFMSQSVAAESTLWITVQDGSTMTDAGEEFRSLLLADVQLQSRKQAETATTPVAQSRMAVTSQGINLTRENALPTLQDALAQEIVKQVRKESS